MISENIYRRLGVMDKKYKKMSIEQVSERIERGRELIEKHGEEGLHWKLKEEDELIDAGLFFSYRVAIDESNYE